MAFVRVVVLRNFSEDPYMHVTAASARTRRCAARGVKPPVAAATSRCVNVPPTPTNRVGGSRRRKHWKKHKPVCRAAVAALARRGTRERLARAVRAKGKDNVEDAKDDDLCVICQDRPVDPVQVG